MTKRRAPLTVENALFRVLGELTVERAAEVTGRAPAYLRAIADPDRREQLTVIDLLALDSEAIRCGHGAPLFETVGALLKSVQSEVFADELAIADVLGELLKEDAEAHQALCRAMRPGAPFGSVEAALVELEQSAHAHQRGMTVLRAIVEQRGIQRTQTGPPAPG